PHCNNSPPHIQIPDRKGGQQTNPLSSPVNLLGFFLHRIEIILGKNIILSRNRTLSLFNTTFLHFLRHFHFSKSPTKTLEIPTGFLLFSAKLFPLAIKLR